MDVTAVTAVLGLALSAALAGLRIYELRARPKLDMHFKWVDTPRGPTLTWVIANIGAKKVIINEVRFVGAGDSDEDGLVWTQSPAETRGIIVPTVLEPDDATYTVSIPEAEDENPASRGNQIAAELRAGKITRAVVETFERDGRQLRGFAVPPPERR